MLQRLMFAVSLSMMLFVLCLGGSALSQMRSEPMRPPTGINLPPQGGHELLPQGGHELLPQGGHELSSEDDFQDLPWSPPTGLSGQIQEHLDVLVKKRLDELSIKFSKSR